MDYYRYPRNRAKIERPDFSCDEYNPSCGDRVLMQGTILDGKIQKLVFQGQGCVISQAVASMLTEACVSKTVPEIVALRPEFIVELAGITLGPTRLKCALLALQSLQVALQTKPL